jgi:hypothetical protein
MRLLQPNYFVIKKSYYWIFLGGVLAVAAVTLIGLKIHKAQTAAPQPMAHTPEYNAVVDEHIDTQKVPRSEVDLSVTKQELGQRFAVYQFSHLKLYGKWGHLYVFVDRQLGKTTSRSLLPIGQQQPEITVKDECLSVPQVKDGLLQNYEICVR